MCCYQEINNRGLKDNFKLLGFRTDINELINISDIGILLSYREGLPRNIMELMANGKKVIATNVRGCRDLVCNDNVGTLVSVGDFKATGVAIKEYYLKKKHKKVTVKLNEVEISDVYGIKEIEVYCLDNINKNLRNIYKDIRSY